MSITYKNAMPKMKSLIICFKVCCVLAASIMIGYWMYKFHKNDDITSIEYKTIMDLDDVVLPELSLCLREPFLPVPLNEIGVTKLKYVQYLMGVRNSTKSYQNIDYHNVTLNIFDYFEKAVIRFKHKKKYGIGACYDIRNCSYLKFKNNYNGVMKGTFFKCFGFEINKKYSKHLDYFFILFNRNLSYAIGEASASLFNFNLPNQLIRNLHGMQPFRWNNDTELGIDLLEVSSIEILKRRNKKEDPCTNDWMSYDQIIELKHLESIGCRAPYQAIQTEIPVCDTKEKMKESLMDVQELAEKHFPPCKEMPSVVYNYGIANHEADLGDNIALYASYPDKWKVITQTQAVDVHALIGNIGGYIGLFLGYAIIQAPEMVLNLYRWFTRRNEGIISSSYKACKRTKTIDKITKLCIKNKISKTLGQNIKGKGVKLKDHERLDANKESMHVIKSKDLKWIITRFEKIDSALEGMREYMNKPSNEDDNSFQIKYCK